MENKIMLDILSNTTKDDIDKELLELDDGLDCGPTFSEFFNTYDKELEDDYNNIWKDIIENVNGTINIEQVKKELYDYSKLMDRTMELYDKLTDGYISKPNTKIEHIIKIVDERISESYAEGYNDALELNGVIE